MLRLKLFLLRISKNARNNILGAVQVLDQIDPNRQPEAFICALYELVIFDLREALDYIENFDISNLYSVRTIMEISDEGFIVGLRFLQFIKKYRLNDDLYYPILLKNIKNLKVPKNTIFPYNELKRDFDSLFI